LGSFDKPVCTQTSDQIGPVPASYHRLNLFKILPWGQLERSRAVVLNLTFEISKVSRDLSDFTLLWYVLHYRPKLKNHQLNQLV